MEGKKRNDRREVRHRERRTKKEAHNTGRKDRPQSSLAEI
jgi:hypothetical protein